MKLPRTYYNYISYLGTIIALIAWVAIIFFVIQINFFSLDNVYFDLFAYLVTPGFLIMGLVMIPLGMYIRRKKIRKGIPVSDEKLLILNLRDPKTRNAIVIFSSVTLVFILFTIVGSYKGFHYTESVEFCGNLCHKVMEPEYVAYQHSPHAKVKCAECHVGEGADFYVKSKMSGMRQVYKYIRGTWPTPIKTPIENLRPARETCEKCHWPEKFYTNKIRNEKYFLADSGNTEWTIVMKMRIGSDHSALGNTEGIHWHINPDVEMTYSSDAKRQYIPWVKYTNKKTGKTLEFIDTDASRLPKKDSINKMEKRPFDCMDCHNRPSHEYRSPSYFVNHLFAGKKIPNTLPWLKKASMDALKNIYSTKDSAWMKINQIIFGFYKENHPEILAKSEKDIKNAIPFIQEAFSQNTFPEMKVRYSAYPRNIGHLESNGCFRCHDDKHATKDGKVISKNCNVCHTIIGQGKANAMEYSPVNATLEFKHPADIGEEWKTTNCSECHAELY